MLNQKRQPSPSNAPSAGGRILAEKRARPDGALHDESNGCTSWGPTREERRQAR